MQRRKSGNGKTDARDLSFGSPESRATARSILQAAAGRPQLSRDESDWLRLYCGAVYINTRMSVGGSHLEKTEAYARGREIWQRLTSHVIPAHRDPKLQRASRASITFEMTFRREPRADDILRLEHVQRLAMTGARHIEELIQAWKRQLPGVPCPLRVDGEVVFRKISNKMDIRQPHPRDGFHWEEAADFSAKEQWRAVELEAFAACGEGRQAVGLESSFACSAVVFLGVVDGKHRCRPLDDNRQL
jgi:hypothetical protein